MLLRKFNYLNFSKLNVRSNNLFYANIFSFFFLFLFFGKCINYFVTGEKNKTRKQKKNHVIDNEHINNHICLIKENQLPDSPHKSGNLLGDWHEGNSNHRQYSVFQ